MTVPNVLSFYRAIEKHTIRKIQKILIYLKTAKNKVYKYIINCKQMISNAQMLTANLKTAGEESYNLKRDLRPIVNSRISSSLVAAKVIKQFAVALMFDDETLHT